MQYISWKWYYCFLTWAHLSSHRSPFLFLNVGCICLKKFISITLLSRPITRYYYFPWLLVASILILYGYFYLQQRLFLIETLEGPGVSDLSPLIVRILQAQPCQPWMARFAWDLIFGICYPCAVIFIDCCLLKFQELNGRNIRVSYATERTSRSGPRTFSDDRNGDRGFGY